MEIIYWYHWHDIVNRCHSFIDSLDTQECCCNFKDLIFKLILEIDIKSIS